MEKPSFKLVGVPCGQQGQYTFYKALRVTTGKQDQILAIGDFFFVRIWQDSELVSIGELQLLWTDRVSDQTLVSLRLYFLPENTPDGRSQHGEDEVLSLNEKVVLRADDLLSWICDGAGWRCGLRAVWRGACTPPVGPATPPDPLHGTRIDFSDVNKEKSGLEPSAEARGVVVFSYPRYCRYRALLARLDGLASAWLRDALLGALGGFAAATANTTILYCKDTFEYPELEGHEFVCNHLAPRLRGRPARGRRRRARSRSHSPSDRDSDSDAPPAPPHEPQKASPRRLSLRATAGGAMGGATGGGEAEEEARGGAEDRRFLRELRQFYSARGSAQRNLSLMHGLKDLSLRGLYCAVRALGGYDAVCRDKLWRKVHALRPTKARGLYARYLRPFELHELSNGCRNGQLDDKHVIHVPDSPRPTDTQSQDEKPESLSPTAEELNRQFLEETKPQISVKPPQLLIDPDKQRKGVMKLLAESGALAAELAAKHNTSDAAVLQEVGSGKLSDSSCSLLSELAQRLQLGEAEVPCLKQLRGAGGAGGAVSLANGHAAQTEQRSRPAGRSSLRAVRVKPVRPQAAPVAPPTAPVAPPTAPVAPAPPVGGRREGSPGGAPVTNFGIHRPPPPPHSDDEIVEVPYKPKTPEIIDLDEYPESPQSTKKKKLDILKERGLEVTAIPPTWGGVGAPPPINPPLLLNPAMQHQIMTQASLFQMYNIIPQNLANGIQPPKIIQSSCVYGSSSPEKTVYNNPKEPFMPAPHVLLAAPAPRRVPPPPRDVLDLTCKPDTPAVEIVRIPTPSKPHNLTKNYTLIDGKAVVGSNLEITLVNPKSQTPPKTRQPQKRSSNGKFMSSKTPTPPRDFSKEYSRGFPSPSAAKASPPSKKATPLTIPTYQLSKDDASPTSSTSSRDSQQNLQSNLLQNVFKNQNSLAQIMDLQKGQLGQNLTQNLGSIGQNLTQMMDIQKSVPLSPFVDPMYMTALYSSLTGQMDQRQLAMYRDLMANQFRYSGLLGGVATPTTKN